MSKWKKVSEWLPWEEGEVICVDRYGEYILGLVYEREDGVVCCEGDGCVMEDVIAWCPIPIYDI